MWYNTGVVNLINSRGDVSPSRGLGNCVGGTATMSHHTTRDPQNTTEEWRPVVGWEHLYEVSSQGRVRSLPRRVKSALQNRQRDFYQRRERILRSAPDSHGHLIVVLCDNTYRRTMPVHRLVADAFLGTRPHGCETHHVNGIMTDNRIHNLVYLPMAEHHALHHNGERSSSAKLTEQDVRSIRNLAGSGRFSQSQIGRMFGISPSYVWYIKKRMVWKHLED